MFIYLDGEAASVTLAHSNLPKKINPGFSIFCSVWLCLVGWFMNVTCAKSKNQKLARFLTIFATKRNTELVSVAYAKSKSKHKLELIFLNFFLFIYFHKQCVHNFMQYIKYRSKNLLGTCCNISNSQSCLKLVHIILVHP